MVGTEEHACLATAGCERARCRAEGEKEEATGNTADTARHAGKKKKGSSAEREEQQYTEVT